MALILVVEDDEQVRVLAEFALREAGHAVVAAAGVEGAQALLEKEDQIDVLFIDLILSGDLEAGLKFAQNARMKKPNISTIYTSGGGVNDGMKALFTEPYLFLQKPYTIEQLTKSVAYVLIKAGFHKKLEIPP